MIPLTPASIWVKAALLLLSTLTVMAGATIAPSLPEMRSHFADFSKADFWVRLVLTAPALFIALGAPIAGLVIDRFGRKPLLAIAALVYGLAGSSGFILSALEHILIGRVFLGLSVAGIMTTATTLIADYYVGAARAQFLGFQAGFMGLGGVVFLSLGGFLADLSWRFPFLIYLFALLLLPLVLFVLPEPNRRDPVATQAVTDSSQSPGFPWSVLILTYGIALITQIIFYMIPVQLPFYLQALTNATASESGNAIALSTLFSSFSAISYQRLKSRFSFFGIYAIAFSWMGVGYLLIGMANSYTMVLLALAIAGSGLGLLMPNMNVCLTASIPAASRGRVLGGLTTAFFLGQFASPLLSQPLSQLRGLSHTYGIAGTILLGMALITLGIMTRWK
jgi:MFS family permease